jgi:hypothetical protein
MGLTYRDVEQASLAIAARRQNDEFAIALSRLADIENRGTVPSLFRLYSLCVIYRLDMYEVMAWYGVDISHFSADVLAIQVERTHPAALTVADSASLDVPLSLDPGVDLRKTTFLSRAIQRWGPLPVALVQALDLKNHRYAFIGSEDWTMHPLLQPGSLVLVDENKRKIVMQGWTNEFERPIYFIEHRDGFECCWCSLANGSLILQPHPCSGVPARTLALQEIDIIGQVTGLATRLGLARRRRSHS